MLDPEYIRRMTEGSEQIASLLHEEIIKRIVARLMARLAKGENYLTSTDRWNLQVLSDAGYLMEDIQAEIAAGTQQLLEEVVRAFEDAAVQALNWDDAVYKAAGLEPAPLRQSPYLMRLAQRNYEKTAGELRNFTGTLAEASQQTFIRQCDRAYQLVAAGAMGYPQAVRQAVEAVAADGVVVTYPSGHRDTIETATLRAVRTGVGQASSAITDARMDEMDWDIVLASAHLGARTGDGGEDWTNHYWWQGKFYSRSGKDERFPPWSVVGEGDVQGFGGPNCRHSKGPGDGVHNPFEHFDSAANREKEELDQRQRLLERRIRKTRREVMALQEGVNTAPDAETREELEAAYRKKAALLQKQEAEYDAFCKEHDLRKLYDRLEVARYGPKQAKAAEQAAEEGNSGTGAPPAPKRIEPEDVTEEYLRTATPGQGEITYDEGYEIGKHAGEIKTARWLRDTFGGDIRLLKEATEKGIKVPDSIWRGKLWEYKTAVSVNAADKRLQDGFKQIRADPGGVIMDVTGDVTMGAVEKQLLRRFIRNEDINSFDLILLLKGQFRKALKYKK